jgi:hypothetical protein
MARELTARNAWRQALGEELDHALGRAEEAAEAMAAIAGAGPGSPLLAACAHDALRQISEAKSTGECLGHRSRLIVASSSFFWQVQAVIDETSEPTGIEAALLPFLTLHTWRRYLQWQAMAQLALKCGVPELADLLMQGAQARRRVSLSVQSVARAEANAGRATQSGDHYVQQRY